MLTEFRFREAAYRTGFDHKYPYAFPTYKAKMQHLEEARKAMDYLKARVEQHEHQIARMSSIAH